MTEIFINDRPVEATEGTTLLRVAREQGISIPHLCFHPALKPSGSCKLCGVEVVPASGRKLVMLSCILKVKPGLRVVTESDRVAAHREKAFKALLELAPDSEKIRDLADRFEVRVPARPNGCIRCRLCVRVCNDVVGARALRMVKTEEGSRVLPGQGRCIGCGTCANLCPTGVMQVKDEGGVRTVSIRDEVVSRLPLERCEACGNRFATADFLARVAHATAFHPHVKEAHAFCPSCTKLMSDRTRTEKERPKK